ncbi:MAG: TetR/AcrR family transcriptional regulator [Eggerthellaceae bacterium]
MPRKGDETKNAFVQAFRHQLETTSLDKVTVTSLTKECGVNRQTFYYHFDDMHSFLQFSYRRFVGEIFLAVKATNNKEDGIRAAVSCVEKEKALFVALLESTEYSWIRRDLLELTSEFIWTRYGRAITRRGLSDKEKGFFIRMYALVIFEFLEKMINGYNYSSVDSFIESVNTFFGPYLVID